MRKQERFPPKGGTSRRVFWLIIAATVVAIGAAGLIGPIMVASGEDPRLALAWLPLISAATMFLGIGWIAWMVFRPRDRR